MPDKTPTLNAFDPPLGVNLQFCSRRVESLKMKAKALSWTGAEFTVTNQDGVDICKCKGTVMSMTDRKEFTNAQGNHLFTLRDKLFKIPRSFRGEGPDGNDLFEIKGHFSMFSSKSTCTFINAADQRPVELEIKGDWLDRRATITWWGQTVANIRRDFFTKGSLLEADIYYADVAPNVDLTLIAALCVALDERETAK